MGHGSQGWHLLAPRKRTQTARRGVNAPGHESRGQPGRQSGRVSAAQTKLQGQAADSEVSRKGGRVLPLLAGTSGWQYRHWRGEFYPAGLATGGWLEYYTTRFPTVENNGTFYRLAGHSTFEQWRARTPPGFVMAIKASRYLTHIRRLREPAEPVARLLDAAAGLGDRLGPVLLQLPPTLQSSPAALADCLDEFDRRFVQYADLGPGRVSVEFRHPSWLTEEVRSILAQHNAAMCWSDRNGRPVGPLWRTADWGYLRLHEGAAQPWPRYGQQSLQSWLRRIAEQFPPDADLFAFFNNDQHCAAPADADALAAIAAKAGWPAARAAQPAGRSPG